MIFVATASEKMGKLNVKTFTAIVKRTEEAKKNGFGPQQFSDLDMLIAEVAREHRYRVQKSVHVKTAERKQIATLKRALMLTIRKAYPDLSSDSYRKLFDYYTKEENNVK